MSSFALTLALLMAPVSSGIAEEIRPLLDRIEHQYGIRVVCCLEDEAEAELRAAYVKKGIQVSALEPGQQARALEALWQALSAYPRDMVPRYVDGVILVRQARMDPLRERAEFSLAEQTHISAYYPPEYRLQPLRVDRVRQRSYRGLSHGGVLVLALGHIEPVFHHELLHRIEAVDADRVPVFAVWEHNRELDGSWRDDCFSPHGRGSGSEDRAYAAEFLFTTPPDQLRELLAGGSVRAQKLEQLKEVYSRASGGLMGYDYWTRRVAEAAAASAAPPDSE